MYEKGGWVKVLHAGHITARPREIRGQDRGKGTIRDPGKDRLAISRN